jgi:SAM-dependent methyltransferase
MRNSNYLPAVKAQYEQLPYPSRNPGDEKHRLLHTAGGSLIAINHFCFRGRGDFRGFRCLVAGGGTGDCVIFLAEQLRDCNAEIIYLDFSETSRKVAEERARVRNLDNISWIDASIMDIPRMQLGAFDFINCSGVLHHLESPEAGLRVLAGSLKDNGAMYLMLYGTYGRRSVYDMQGLLREYLPADADTEEKLRLSRQLISALPETNSFRRDLRVWADEISDDAGLFDLLLHSQDVSFSVPEIYALARNAKLSVLGFTGFAQSHYEPREAVADDAIRRYLDTLDTPSRQSIAEQLHCDINKHEFFVGKGDAATASLDEENNTLIATGSLYLNAPKIAASMVDGRTLNYEDNAQCFSLSCNPVVRIVFAHMDGRTSLRKLYKKITAQAPGTDIKDARAAVASLFHELNRKGFVFLLRNGSQGTRIPDYQRLIETPAGPIRRPGPD